MKIRPYNPEIDKEATHRIWKEVHWITKDQEPLMDHFLSGCRVLVAEIDGAAECLVSSSSGEMRYLNQDLKLSAITAVTTSRIARKQGLAGRLTAQLIAEDAAEGAHIAALGMFEQGYYDRLGFGTGPYENMLYLNPADLRIDQSFRVPQRLNKDDWERIHQAALARLRGHGSCNLYESSLTRAELGWTDAGFGLGYFDAPDKKLSHYLWMSGEEEHGPYTLKMLIYQNHAQLLELLALLKSLGDQIHLIRIFEPPEIQIQDLIKQPFRGRQQSKRSPFEQKHTAEAFWQVRICDLYGCLENTHLNGKPIRFNLDLHDPIESKLDASQTWRGISGKYTISLGPESKAKAGTSKNLLTLSASVGAFTRLWLGVRPASGLAVTDELSGPESLLQDLDELIRLPAAHLGWEF